MAEQAGSFVWQITADSSQFEKQLKDLPSKVDVLKSKVEETDYAIDKNLKSTNMLANSFSGLKDQILSTGKVSEETAGKIASATIEEEQAYKNLTGSLDDAEKGLEDLDTQTQENVKSTISLKEALSGLITVALAMKVFRFVKDQLKEAVEQANQANRVIAQTNSIVQSTGMVAGHSAEQVQDLAQQIQKNTAIQDEHAQAGINMLLTYTRIGEEILPKATQAMVDMATATNDGAIPTTEKLSATAKQLGSALNDPVQGIGRLTETGITFTEAQKDQIKALVESGNVMEAQSIILDRLSIFQGSAEDQARTFEGRVNTVNNALNDLRTMIGNSILPVLVHFVEGLKIGEGAVNGLVIAVRVLSSVLLGVISVARGVGIVLSTIFSAVWMALTGDFENAVNVIKVGFEDLLLEGVRTQQALSDVWSDEANKRTDFSLSAFENEELGSGKKTKKILDDLAKETEAYQRAVEKRKVQFERALADLIWAHQDKVKKLKEDLTEENRSYAVSISEREKDFKESMVEMEQAHLKKVETIEKQLAREQQKQDDKVAEVIKKGSEQLSEEERLHDKRIRIIESQIANELSKGEYASDSVLATLNARLENEKTIYANKVEDIKNQIDDETKKAIDANKNRIEDLEQSLDEQSTNFAKESEKRELTYEEETTKLQQEHAKRVSNFQTTLDEELGILSTHQDSVNSIKDQARIDDITRLKRQFEEQAKEEEANHQRRLADIRNRGDEAGTTYGNQTASGLAKTSPTIQNTMAGIGTDAKNSFARNVSSGMESSGRGAMDNFFRGVLRSISSWWSNVRDSVSRLFSDIPMGYSLFGGGGGGGGGGRAFADGVTNFDGGLALVGERGPEIVNLPRGSDVIPNEVAFGDSGYGGGGQAIINIGQVNERSDVDMITRELGFRSSISR